MKVPVAVIALAVFASAGPNPAKVAKFVVDKLTWDPNARIINGQEATPHSLPYMVHLLFAGSDSAWICGGALISENFVLTAAHCGHGAETVYVTLGAHNTSAQEDTQVKATVPGGNIKIHEAYTSEVTANDIAIIKLPFPITFTDAIKTVDLPTRSDVENDYVDALATASGWGLTDGTGTTPSDVLNYVQMKVISNTECQLYFVPAVSEKSVCTSGEDNTSVCMGDSGSPLVTDGVVIGVSAFVAPQCIFEYPSGWTRVTDYLEWISVNTDIEIK